VDIEASVTLAGSSKVEEARSLQEWVAHMRWFIGGTARVNWSTRRPPSVQKLETFIEVQKAYFTF